MAYRNGVVMTRTRTRLYRRIGAGMLRAAVNLTAPPLPAWPRPGSSIEQWRSWLAPVWADESFRQAVTNASPDLARQVAAILDGRLVNPRRARRAALSLARYALRYAHRSTPFGLFAGISLIKFGEGSIVRVGDTHDVVARPDPAPLDTAISAYEADGELMAGVELCVNNLVRMREGRVHVPAEGASEFSLALTPEDCSVPGSLRAGPQDRPPPG
ncbi:lantibiotic dehydratase [Streptosporangium sandarakinum]|uniref:lantibiotic dehydratase n=1 Tax=Streptosporangium sandarakinum TaxID=1260955 RepID=UPI0037ACD006